MLAPSFPAGNEDIGKITEQEEWEAADSSGQKMGMEIPRGNFLDYLEYNESDISLFSFPKVF